MKLKIKTVVFLLSGFTFVFAIGFYLKSNLNRESAAQNRIVESSKSFPKIALPKENLPPIKTVDYSKLKSLLDSKSDNSSILALAKHHESLSKQYHELSAAVDQALAKYNTAALLKSPETAVLESTFESEFTKLKVLNSSLNTVSVELSKEFKIKFYAMHNIPLETGLAK